MKLTILRIENRIVTVQLDNGTIIDIARRWFAEDIEVDDIIEFEMSTDSYKSKKMGS